MSSDTNKSATTAVGTNARISHGASWCVRAKMMQLRCRTTRVFRFCAFQVVLIHSRKALTQDARGTVLRTCRKSVLILECSELGFRLEDKFPMEPRQVCSEIVNRRKTARQKPGYATWTAFCAQNKSLIATPKTAYKR